MECCLCNKKMIKIYINNSENSVSNDTTIRGIILKYYSSKKTDTMFIDTGPLTSINLPSSTSKIEFFWVNRKKEQLFIQREDAPFRDNIKIKQI